MPAINRSHVLAFSAALTISALAIAGIAFSGSSTALASNTAVTPDTLIAAAPVTTVVEAGSEGTYSGYGADIPSSSADPFGEGPIVPGEVTTAGAPADPTLSGCAPISFAPNSDDMASNISALGVSCEDATAMITQAAEMRGATQGPAYFELTNGYRCVAAEVPGTELPVSLVSCTTPTSTITFERT